MKKIVLLLALCTLSLHSFDNFHFYRASYFVGEPRFIKPGLGSFDFYLASGGTCRARDCVGCGKTCLLNIYGLHNMHDLGVNVPCKDLSDPVDIVLTNLALVPSRAGFGQLLFKGDFSIAEAIIQFTQNFTRGFFMQIGLPLRRMSISNVNFTDCSPHDDLYPNINTPAWQAFLNMFPAILAKYNLYIGNTTSMGIGDASFYLGWAYSYTDTEVIDYVDTEFKIGVYAPTGKERNQQEAFSLPTGYDGHVGIPIQFNAAVGSYDWVTLGMHAGGIAFLDKKKNVRIKTALSQNGFIKLACAQACVKKGNIWHAGGFFKADHFCRGLSFVLGYTFAQENKSRVSPLHAELCNQTIVNSDGPLLGWSMHTVHFIFDYDFTQEDAFMGSHFSLFYNWQVAGKRTFNTSMAGGQLGLDFSWTF